MYKLLTRLVLCASCVLLGGTFASAETSATPAAKATPKPAFTYGGNLRAFYFTRTNGFQNAANTNRAAFNFGGKLHGEYHFANSPFTLGATYFGADPFEANGNNPGFSSRVDNTLPGFSLSTLGEAYLQYSGKTVQAKIGNMVINTPWANASDSRIKPVAFQGIDAQAELGSGLTIGVDRMTRFEHRTSSAFERRTLLTDAPAGNPAYPIYSTNGFLSADIGYHHGPFTGTLWDYQFYDIANMVYAEGKLALAPTSPLKPYLAAQFVNETQTGRDLVGTIDNQTFGALLGASLSRNVDVSLAYDHSPWHSYTTNAASCAAAGAGFFLPAGGTPDCVNNNNGSYTVYYGGIASPYTEAYATDPLYTTSISQGMADRHSAGDGYKFSTTLQTNDKRFRAILSDAYYNYGNAAGPNKTKEFDADVTYFMNHVGPGAYRGFSIRHRYADRTQPNVPFDFKYNRTQLEYDF